MSSVLEPGSCGGDVVGGALALHLDEDGHVGQVLAVPLVERRQQLQTVRGRGHVYLYLCGGEVDSIVRCDVSGMCLWKIYC